MGSSELLSIRDKVLMVDRQVPSSMTRVWAPTHVEEHMRYGAPQVHFVGLEPEFAFVRPSR